jgi:hypothetical protein
MQTGPSCPVCGANGWRPFAAKGAAGLEICRYCRLVRRAGRIPSPVEPASPPAPPLGPVAHLEVRGAVGRADDPDAFVAGLAAALAAGGLLHLVEPDIHHWRRPRDLARWPGFAPEATRFWFGARTLTRLLERHGLMLVSRRRLLRPEIDLLARRR